MRMSSSRDELDVKKEDKRRMPDDEGVNPPVAVLHVIRRHVPQARREPASVRQ
jgi:hypothetical protein